MIFNPLENNTTVGITDMNLIMKAETENKFRRSSYIRTKKKTSVFLKVICTYNKYTQLLTN